MSEHVNLGHARHHDQRETMERSVGDGVCPFCIDSLKKYHKKPILNESDFWIVTTNQWPYKNTIAHYLFIAKKHVENLAELEIGAMEDLGNQIKIVAKNNSVDYGGLVMRFGDPEYTGGTVNHLHAHLIQAVKEMPEGEKVRFKISR